MHIRTPNAAVDAAVSPASARATVPSPPSPGSALRPQTLWASRPMPVRAGRLIGVRLATGELQVALVENGATQLRWVRADRMLTDRQAEEWARNAVFRRTR